MECLATNMTTEAAQAPANETSKLYSCRYEVFGKLHHVCFRDQTEEKAKSLNIRGFVMYSSRHTIIGEMQGHTPALKEMKLWLEYKGSPLSRIDKVTFTELKQIKKYSFPNFSVKYES